jgi:hypothetical protein
MTDADTTVLVRVTRAAGTIQIEKAVQAAAAAGHCHIVAGILPVRHGPLGQRGGWQFSLSHRGQPLVVITQHQYKRDAEAQVVRVSRANSERDLRDDAAFAQLIQELAAFGDGEAA